MGGPGFGIVAETQGRRPGGSGRRAAVPTGADPAISGTFLTQNERSALGDRRYGGAAPPRALVARMGLSMKNLQLRDLFFSKKKVNFFQSFFFKDRGV